MIKNEWLDNEVLSIAKEMRATKNRGDKLFPYLMIMVVILLLLTCRVCAEEEQQSCYCPHCNSDISEVVCGYNIGWLFPSTWYCPNPKCGYENYEGLDYCAMCGTRKR